MTTLSKLKEEGRREFEKRFGAFALLGKAGRFYNGAFANEARIREAQDYLDSQIEKAYLAALSDVEKGLPADEDMRPEITHWLVNKDYSKGRNSMLNEVKEVIKKLREKNE